MGKLAFKVAVLAGIFLAVSAATGHLTRWAASLQEPGAAARAVPVGDLSAIAKAVLTSPDGSPLPATIPAGTILAVTAANSTAGQRPGSIRLEVEPPDVAKGVVRLDRAALVPAGPAGQAITLRLYVAKDDTLDACSYSVLVAAAPPPTPTPTPTPAPTPTGNIDPAIRKAAAAFFAAYPARYAADRSRIAATDVLYNELMEQQLKDRNALGTALGQAIDAKVRPVVGDDGKFKGKAAAADALGAVADSLRAGLIDASQK